MESGIKKKLTQGDYALYYADECHFRRSFSTTRTWHSIGTPFELTAPTGHDKISIFGALGQNGQLINMPSVVFNAATFRLFLDKLISQASVVGNDGRRHKILLVLDNARYHRAKALQEWLQSVSDLLELYFLPPYSPDLNPIEMLWRETRRNVTHNHYFPDMDTMTYDLIAYWNIFSKPNPVLAKLSASI
jgi:hypothetical protein